jgi:hypothetical protein
MQASMTNLARGERGIALPIAIFALVVIGALVAGAFFAGNQEQRLAQNAKRVTQSFGVAEFGLAEVVRNWDPVAINQIPSYPVDSAPIARTTTPGGSGSYNGYVYKLNNNLFLADITGSDTASLTNRIAGGGARQRLGLLTRIRPLQVDIQAGLTTQGDVTVRGNAEVNGNDQIPTGWANCALPGPQTAAVRTTPGSNVTTSGNGQIIGSVNHDPQVTDETFTQFGDVDFEDLVSRAQVTLPGGTYRSEPRVVGTSCDRTVPTNWGDGLNPASPCARYFPIVYIDGDVTLNGVQGQGILLVRGNLEVQGSYEYFGIAIALGEIRTAGGGTSIAHFWGGVLARNANLDTQNLSGQATLNFSRCAILRALQATGVAAPLRSRGWSQLY